MRTVRIVCSLLLSLSLFGCSDNEIQISEEDALEVALDNEGLVEEDISDTKISKKESTYTITFNTVEGSYKVKVGFNGSYQGKKFTPNEVETTEKKESENKTNKATAPIVEKKKIETPEDLERKVFEDMYQTTLNALGIKDYYVDSVKVKEEENRYVIRIKLTNGDGLTYVTIIDKNTLNVLDWYSE